MKLNQNGFTYFFLRRLFAAVRFGGWLAAFLGRACRLVNGWSSSSSSLLFDSGSSFAAFSAASDSFDSELALLASEWFCCCSSSFSLSSVSPELECDPSEADPSSDDEWFAELFDWLTDDVLELCAATVVFGTLAFFDGLLRCDDALLEFDELDEPLLEDDDEPSESLV